MNTKSQEIKGNTPGSETRQTPSSVFWRTQDGKYRKYYPVHYFPGVHVIPMCIGLALSAALALSQFHRVVQPTATTTTDPVETTFALRLALMVLLPGLIGCLITLWIMWEFCIPTVIRVNVFPSSRERQPTLDYHIEREFTGTGASEQPSKPGAATTKTDRYQVGWMCFGSAQQPTPPFTVYYPTRILATSDVRGKPKDDAYANANASNLRCYDMPWSPWGDFEYITHFAEGIKLPRFFMNHLQYVSLRNYLPMQQKMDSTWVQSVGPLQEVVIFSHGLFGQQQMYSALMLDLASQGCLVIAPSHRDGSASYCGDDETLTTLSNGPWWNPASPNSYGYQLPPSSSEAGMLLRNKQLKHRVQELEYLIKSVLEGTLPPLDAIRSSSTCSGDAVVDYRTLPIRLVGHSFGGCTILALLQSLAAHHALHSIPAHRFRTPVVLDAWLEPIVATYRDSVRTLLHRDQEARHYYQRIARGITFLDSQQWQSWTTHRTLHVEMAEECFTAFNIPWLLCTIRGTDHYTASDMGILLRRVGRKRQRTSMLHQQKVDRNQITLWANEIVRR